MEVVVKDSEVQIPEKPILRYHQRENMQREIEEITDQVNPGNPFKHRSGPDVSTAISRMREIKRTLEAYSPPPLAGTVKDKIAKKADELREQIVQGMPTQEEMRKNPAGMVDRHMKWEKANKKKILAWKNAQILLEPDSSDKDLANFERFRPEGQMDRFRGDAQINGHMSYGNIPEWVWERIFEKAPNSALVQAKKVEAEQAAQKEPEQKIDKRTLPRTEEQKQALRDRLALARANKDAKQAGDPVSPQEGESVPFEGA